MALRYGGVFEQDNIRYLISSSRFTAAATGIVEGDYNTWTLQWVNYFPHGLADEWDCEWIIDERHQTFMMGWASEPAAYLEPRYSRFGIFNLADFSTVYLSPENTNYLENYPTNAGCDGVKYRGCSDFSCSAFATSSESYVILMRFDEKTVEVWQGGAAPLWSVDLTTVFSENLKDPYAGFSVSGKWILMRNQKDGYGDYKSQIACFKGFDAGTSTAVTETTITDTSKSWIEDDLIGHTVYVTSGGANGWSCAITGNTSTTITSSVATFVTWGMSIGDTYKID